MRKGGGKSKGNQFERDQARLISLWLSNGEDPDLLWRSSSSGGRASSGKTTAHFGDLGIQKTDSLYTEQAKRFLDIFSVEIKRYKVVSLTKAFLSDKSQVSKWWFQCCSDAAKFDRNPMLIMKGNNDECLVVLPFEIGISILFNKFEFDICTIINDSMVIAIIKQKDLLNIKWKDFYIEIDRILGA